MHAVPDKWKLSRWASYVSQHKRPPDLPELKAGGYLLESLHLAGAFIQGDMGGVSPITWLELDAFCRMTGRLGLPWEAETVIKLSREYVAGYDIGLNALGIPPYDTGKTTPTVSAGLFSSLKRRAKNG